jgi:lysyl-tRNA synthetase, class II
MMPLMSEADIRADRLKKIDRLHEAGMDPYPAKAEPTASISQFVSTFAEREANAQPTTLVGRVMASRGQGGIMFADLDDGTARVQAVLQKDDMDEMHFALYENTVDTGDFIEVTGTAYTTKRGAQSIKVQSWRMIAKSLLPIPDSWYGLKDEELILRQRYLDVLLNEDVRALFIRRAKFWQTIRNFYLERGFLEVETPVLESSPGGADARPFSTHHNALDIDVSLRISLELWLKRLLVAGYPKVFEIGRIFRNEGQSREHLQDYTQLESYEAFKDMRDGMEFVQELYRAIAKNVYGQYTFEINGHTVDFADNWTVIDFVEVIQKEYGINVLSCSEDDAVQAAKNAGVVFGDAPNKSRAVDGLWKLIRKTVAGPAFLVGVPVYLEPLAKRVAGQPNVVERFQVILAGSEMGKGFSELNDPQDQRARFEEQQKLRDAGDDEAQRLDEDYVRAMEYGMPPSFGFGMSERMFSFLENRPAHETQIFPLLRPKSE